MEQRGCEVCVGDLLDTEGIQHLQVELGLGDLELGDSRLTMVNGKECDELLEVLDLLFCNLDRGLFRKDGALLL